MRQTIKFGKVRAMGDPDRDATTHGRHFGVNMNRNSPITPGWSRRCRTTRGSFVKRG